MDDPIFGKAFEKSPVGMALLDSRGMILEVNPALSNTIEKEAAVLRGGYLDDHMNAEDGRKWRGFYKDFTNGLALDYYFEAIFYPSKPREAWWSIQLGDLDREIDGQRVFFAVIQDITLKKVNEYKLKEARINAERASRAKSQFLANMSHEIRTPIHTITGMAELLLDSNLPPDQRDYARQVSLSADVLVSLIEDVLDFSKIEAGRMVLENAPFDLLKILDQSLELVSLNASKKNLELALFVENRVPHQLIGDAHRLRQVIVNLLANAVKFTSEGEICLTAGVVSDDDSTATIRISVKDTGIGLDEHVKENLFEAFYQGDSSTTRKYGGTGLGLAISRRLVKMMGGDFQVHSTIGQGSEFIFSFTMKKQANANLYRSVSRDFFEQSCIMVVEENPTNRTILQNYLTDWGCAVKVYDTGESALQGLWTMTTTLPSAILMGQEGPHLNPWGLAHKIRQDSRLDQTQLILMAPYGKKMDTAKNRAPDLFQAYITKPIKRQELLETIFRSLNQESLSPPTGQFHLFGRTQEPAASPPPSGRTIVVAEDNDVNRELFNLLLKKLGHKVHLASNGLEAVELFAKYSPDLIFMDLQMPEMNGFEAATKIRKGGSNVPIVAVTASALKGEMERCLKTGMNDFITKPFKSQDLMEVLSRILTDPSTTHLEKIIQEAPGEGPIAKPDSGINPLTIFNADEALQTFLGKKDILTKLLTNFLPKVEAHLANIRKALAEGDLETVFKEAHAIKGSSLNLSANDLGSAAAALEKAGRNQRSEESSDLANLLDRAYARFKQAIEAFLKE